MSACAEHPRTDKIEPQSGILWYGRRQRSRNAYMGRPVSQRHSDRDNLAWLQIVLASVAASALVLLYVLLSDDRPGPVLLQLLLDLIPNLLAALLVVLIVYLLLVRRGIPSARQIAEEVVIARAEEYPAARLEDVGLV